MELNHQSGIRCGTKKCAGFTQLSALLWGVNLLLRNEGCHGIAVGNFECHLLYIIAS